METQGIRYINPLTDFGFKKVFGDEDIMCDFLNDIIEPKSPIVKVEFLDKEMPPETKYERGIIYDMRCRLQNDEEVIVEMQNRGQDYFKDRICYYMARAVSDQGDRGDHEWEFNIHPVYGIFFMNFHLKRDPSEEEARHDIKHFALKETNTGEVFTDKLQFWLLELPRYRKMSEADCKTNKDYWLYILTHLETMNTAVPFKNEKPIFHKLENIADIVQLSREEREHYNITLDSYRTSLAVMHHERNEGREEGRAEGRAEGREEERNEILEKLRGKGMSEEEINALLG